MAGPDPGTHQDPRLSDRMGLSAFCFLLPPRGWIPINTNPTFLQEQCRNIPTIDLGHWERPRRLRKLTGVAGGGGSGRWGGVGCVTGLERQAGSSAWRWGSVSRRQVPQSDDEKAWKQAAAT